MTVTHLLVPKIWLQLDICIVKQKHNSRIYEGSFYISFLTGMLDFFPEVKYWPQNNLKNLAEETIKSSSFPVLR